MIAKFSDCRNFEESRGSVPAEAFKNLLLSVGMSALQNFGTSEPILMSFSGSAEFISSIFGGSVGDRPLRAGCGHTCDKNALFLSYSSPP